MEILETNRLQVMEFSAEDAPFILELVNEPAWIEFIGDKNVKNLKDAAKYINEKLRQSYVENGFGLFKVVLKPSKETVGMCGLVKRQGLAHVDIGFAFLNKHRRNGYAFESANAILKYAKKDLNLEKVIAITNPQNEVSGKLLEKLGFKFESMINLSQDGKDVCRLFVPVV